MNKKSILLCAVMVIIFASSVAAAGLSYFTIRNNMQNMTDLHFKEYVNSIKGTPITWTGWVVEVKEKWLGGYEVWIDMDSPESFSVQDITFEITKAEALSLNKDQKITFTGAIENVIGLLGSCSVTLSNPKIK